MVHSVDASFAGFGISSSIWHPSQVAEVSRIRGRFWWKLGAERAREHAVLAAGFAMGTYGKHNATARGMQSETLAKTSMRSLLIDGSLFQIS